MTAPSGTSRAFRLAAEVAVLTALTLAILVAILHLWHLSPRVPLQYEGDAIFYQAIVKGELEEGWYNRNPQLGAPFEQELYDFPLGGDNLHNLTYKVTGWLLTPFDPDFGLVVNAFFFGTFVAATLSCYAVLRVLGVSRLFAGPAALIFSFAPYHFFRGEVHLPLSAYWPVPLAVLVLLRLLGPSPFADRRRAAAAAAIAVVLGVSGTYYAAFFLLLLAAVVAVRVLAERTWRVCVPGAVVAGICAGSFLVNQLPTILYQREHGANTVVANRQLAASDTMGLRIAQTLLPVNGHRIEAFSRIANKASDLPFPSGGQALGFVAACGYALLLVTAVSRIVRRGPPVPEPDVVGRLSFLAVAGTLLATAGGLSVVIGMLSTKLRAWHRMGIFLSCFALFALAWLAQRWRERAGARGRAWPHRRMLMAAIGTALVVVAVTDQTTAGTQPEYAQVGAAFARDRSFFGEMQQMLGAGAQVFQFPIIPYPEAGPRERMQDYDHLRGYLHAPDLRWSYGAMKGRPEADWQFTLYDDPNETIVPELAAIGYDALYIDRWGYADGAEELETAIRTATGGIFRSSGDGRMSWLDLRPYAAELRARNSDDDVERARNAILYPVDKTFGTGFDKEQLGAQGYYHRARRPAVLQLENPLDQRREVRLTFAALVESPGVVTLTMTGAGTTRRFEVDGTQSIDVTVEVGPGTTSIDFEASAGVFQIVNFGINEDATKDLTLPS